MEETIIGPTPKTKRLDELTAKNRVLLANLLTKNHETDDAQEELQLARKQFSKILWFRKNVDMNSMYTFYL